MGLARSTTEQFPSLIDTHGSDNQTSATMRVGVRSDQTDLSRRDFLGKVGLGAAAVAANVLVTPTLAAAIGSSTFGGRQTVAVFGGGIAGLTAAHELAERGFDVTIYERRAWGGKARSTEVPGSAAGGRKPLPGEHSFRIFFGFYQNIPDTMRRIPFRSNSNGVFDNLVAAPQYSFARTNKHDVALPLGGLDPRPYTPQQLLDLLLGLTVDLELPPLAAVHFVNRLIVFLSSCDERRLGQWEPTSWANFIGSNSYGDDYRKILGALPQFIQASKAENTSTKFVGRALELLVYSLLGLGSNGPTIRVLNLPTNEAWINPWLAHLQGLGTKMQLATELTGFVFSNGRIAAANVGTPSGPSTVVADWYVCALPMERARTLWSPTMLAADPSLSRTQRLGTAWMNAIQFFLRDRSQILKGHVECVDSPWAITLLTQAQFWSVDFASTYGDGRAHDKMSALVTDWTKPGIVFGKAAQDCAPGEVAREVWEQIKRHVNKAGLPPKLTDDSLLSWDIDPGMILQSGHLVSEDPLVLPTAGTEQYRPDVTTGIPNLVLTGDYLNGTWEIANMESANFNGRRAANAVLERSGSTEQPSMLTGTYRPPEWEPLKLVDQARFKVGQPNLFDLDLTLPQLNDLLAQASTNLSGLVAQLEAGTGNALSGLLGGLAKGF